MGLNVLACPCGGYFRQIATIIAGGLTLLLPSPLVLWDWVCAGFHLLTGYWPLSYLTALLFLGVLLGLAFMGHHQGRVILHRKTLEEWVWVVAPRSLLLWFGVGHPLLFAISVFPCQFDTLCLYFTHLPTQFPQTLQAFGFVPGQPDIGVEQSPGPGERRIRTTSVPTFVNRRCE